MRNFAATVLLLLCSHLAFSLENCYTYKDRSDRAACEARNENRMREDRRDREAIEAGQKAEANRWLNEYLAKQKSTQQQQNLEQLERDRQYIQSRDALIKQTSDEFIPIAIAAKKSESLLKDGQCRPAQDALDEVEIRTKLATSTSISKELMREAITTQQLEIFKLCAKASERDNQRQLYLRSESSKGNTFAQKILQEDDAAKSKSADARIRNAAAKKSSIELGDLIAVLLKPPGKSGLSMGSEKEKLITWGVERTFPGKAAEAVPMYSENRGYLKIDSSDSTGNSVRPGKRMADIWDVLKIRFENGDLLEYILVPPREFFGFEESLRKARIIFREICKDESMGDSQIYYRLSDEHGNEAILRSGIGSGGNSGESSNDLGLLFGPRSNSKLKCGLMASNSDGESCCLRK